MSGPGQHFLPRFLMQGFSSRVRKNAKKTEYYTWVFTKDGPLIEPNLVGIGKERYFYGPPGENSVDKKITDQEDDYALPLQLNALRTLEKGCELESSFPEELIIHLFSRAKHIRQSVQEGAEAFVAAAQKKLDSPETFLRMMSNLVETKPELIVESLNEKLEKHFPPNITKQGQAELVKVALGALPQMLPSVAVEGHNTFDQMFGSLIEKMSELMKNAHIDALGRDVSVEKWGKHFEGFCWNLNVSKEPKYILGDIGPVFRLSPCQKFRSLVFSEGKITEVFLPISDRHMIVGKLNVAVENPSDDEINFASASLSQDFFVSSQCGKKETSLASYISSEASNITPDKISKLEGKLDEDWFGR